MVPIEKIISDIKDVKVISDKINWIKKWMGRNLNLKNAFNLALTLVAAMCTEGIFFSSSFLAIYWICSGGKNISKKGQLKELGNSNVLISRDEGTHARLWIQLIVMIIEKDFNEKETKLFYKEAEVIIREAVKIEKKFVDECLKVEFLGMKRNMARKYIEYVTDCLVRKFGMDYIYYADNPFPIMDLLNLKKKENFFEQRSQQYRKATIHKNTFINKSIF